VSPLRLSALLLGLTLLLGALLLGGLRVTQLVRRELEHEGTLQSLAQREGAPGSTRISARLADVDLESGEHATFEVCAEGDLGAAPFDGKLDFVVWRTDGQRLELRVPLDAAHRALVKRAGHRSCLPLGGGTISMTTRYALDAVWPGRTLSPELAAMPLRARVLAKRPLGLRDGVLVLSAALGAMLCVLSAFVPGAPESVYGSPWRGPLWALAFGVLGAALFRAGLHVSLPLSAGGLVRGLVLCLIESGFALLGARLLYRRYAQGLHLFAPAQRAALWLFAACGAALLLRVLSHFSLRLVPSTGEAPIEAFISWPSGALTFALLGMAVPLAEELFFRGFVFGALRSKGLALACAGTITLFALAHAQQVWGNWGALLSVTITGTVLTLLRAGSGSTLVPAVAHVLFNLSLWRDSFSA
jgi:membrane protease YdiL (CAAX protease family)